MKPKCERRSANAEVRTPKVRTSDFALRPSEHSATRLLCGALLIASCAAGFADSLDNWNLRPQGLKPQAASSNPQAASRNPQSSDFPGKYILASAVLPGAGEMLRGKRVKGEVFLWTDAAIWLTYGGLTVVGNSRNQDARLYARRYSGANPNVGSDDYYVALEHYPDSDQYNEDIRREARELYPNDPEKQKSYSQSHYYTGDNAWSWGSDSLRLSYWDIRTDARNLLHTAGFLLGAALLNRLVSAVDVAFFSPRSRAGDQGAGRLDETRLGFTALPCPDRPGLSVVYRF